MIQIVLKGNDEELLENLRIKLGEKHSKSVVVKALQSLKKRLKVEDVEIKILQHMTD